MTHGTGGIAANPATGGVAAGKGVRSYETLRHVARQEEGGSTVDAHTVPPHCREAVVQRLADRIAKMP